MGSPSYAVDKSQMFVRERAAQAAQLTRAGHSANTIAVRLGVTPRTVIRYRARHRQPQTA